MIFYYELVYGDDFLDWIGEKVKVVFFMVVMVIEGLVLLVGI